MDFMITSVDDVSRQVHYSINTVGNKYALSPHTCFLGGLRSVCRQRQNGLYREGNNEIGGMQMIKTDEFGRVTVGGMIDSLFAEYVAAGRAIARGAIAEGYDERVLRALFELCFSGVMEVLEGVEKK